MASCSRASASRWRAPPVRCSPAFTPATRASIPTPRPCRIFIRICLARGSSPGKASTMSTRLRRPSKTASPKTRSFPRPLRRPLMREPRSYRTSRSWTTTRRASSPTRDDSTDGSGETGRSCLAVPVRADANRAGAQPSAAHLAMEDSRNLRRSLVAPAAVALFLASWTVLPAAPGLDAGRSGGAGVRAVAVARRNRSGSAAVPALGRAGARPCGRREDRAGACVAPADVCRIPGLPDDACHRDHDRARGGHPSQDAGVADRRDRGVAARAGRAQRHALVREADAGQPAVRGRRADRR